MKRVECRSLIGLLAILLFCGFGSAERQDDLEQVTLMLDWVPNVNHVGLFIARDEGFFADEGLQVEIVQPGEVLASAMVAAGKVEFGIDFQESVTLLQSEETSIVSIAALLQHNTSGFATRSADAIRSPAEFVGLRYATFQSPFEAPTLKALVGCAAIDTITDEIQFVPGGSDLLAMLQTDKADLIWIYYGTQGFQAERLGIKIDYFPLTDYSDCIPNYYTPLLITNRELLERRPETVRRFLRALNAAYRFVIAASDRAADRLAITLPELDRTELRRSLSWLTHYMEHPERGWGWQEAQVWSDYANWMADNGLIDASTIDIGASFTNRFLPAYPR